MSKHHHRRRHKSFNKKFILFVAIGVVAIITIFLVDYIRQNQYTDWAQRTRKERESEELLQEQERAKKEAEDSFYQKLADGFDVNVLIVGDDIAQGTGAGDKSKSWASMLQIDLQRTYGCKVNFTNLAMGGGNSSYPGYVRIMTLEDEVDYDLAIICCGQYDMEEKLSLYYEAMIRAIQNKYSKCSIISVLESAQQNNTNKIKIQKSLCSHYGIPLADTITAFQNSGKEYSALTKKGVYPNNEGQQIYFDTVKSVIEQGVSENTSYDFSEVLPVNENVGQFQYFRYLGAKEFTKTDDVTYTLQITISGMMGIDYNYLRGENMAEIYVDGELLDDANVDYNYSDSQRYILTVKDNCTVQKEIKVRFGNAKQAAGFRGIIFSSRNL